jgi:heme-degrading monooxygenase HmoA
MLARIWTTGIDVARADEYERFAREESLPMFHAQPGFRGVLMMREGDTCRVITLWEDQAAIDRLADSPGYQATVRRIVATGFLKGGQTTEVGAVHLLDLKPWEPV